MLRTFQMTLVSTKYYADVEQANVTINTNKNLPDDRMLHTVLTYPMTSFRGYKIKQEGKDQESIQSSTTPDPGHHIGKGQNTRKYHIQESQEVSPFPAGDHKAAMNREEYKTATKHKQLYAYTSFYLLP